MDSLVAKNMTTSRLPDETAAESTTVSGSARRRERAEFAKTQSVTWLSVFCGLLIWELLGRFVVQNSLFLATPLQAVEAMVELWLSGELQHHIWVSGQEFIIGFVAACLAGIVIGLFMASFERVANALNPWVSGIYATPIVAVAPLFILWFGIGVWSKVAVVVSLVIFPVIINTEVGIRSVDRQLVEVVRAFGANRMQIFFKISLPAATPFILAGVRLGVGRGLIGVVVGELFGSRAGLGFLIMESAEVFNMPRIFAGILVLAIAGIVLTALFRKLERWLAPWY